MLSSDRARISTTVPAGSKSISSADSTLCNTESEEDSSKPSTIPVTYSSPSGSFNNPSPLSGFFSPVSFSCKESFSPLPSKSSFSNSFSPARSSCIILEFPSGTFSSSSLDSPSFACVFSAVVLVCTLFTT